MLHDVIVFGYMLHTNNPTNFSNIYYFFIIEKSGLDGRASRARFGPRVVVWRP